MALGLGKGKNLRHDASDSNHHAKDRLVPDCPAGGGPAEGDDGARLDVADDGAGDRPRLGDDEKLGDVDERGEAAGLQCTRVSRVIHYKGLEAKRRVAILGHSLPRGRPR